MLVLAQSALAVVVLAGAGLLVRSLMNLQGQELGFRRENVMIAQLGLPWSKFDTPDGAERLTLLINETQTRVAAVPGVASVAVVNSPPYSGTGGWDALPNVEGQAADEAARRPWVNMEIVTPNYFATLGVPLLRGRLLTRLDRSGAQPVTVINATMAKQYWPNADPIGKRLRLGAPGDSAAPRFTVVGIVGDMRYRELTTTTPSFYLPNEQFPRGAPTFFLVRTTSSLGSIVPAIRVAFRSVDADASLVHARMMDDYLAGPLARPRFASALIAFFAAAGLLLIIVGTYAIVAEHVRQYRRELGIRVALGARAADVRHFVLGVGLVPLAAGATTGLIASVAGGRVVRPLLYGVTPADPLTLVGVVTLVSAAALIACAFPLRQAHRVAPAEILRAD